MSDLEQAPLSAREDGAHVIDRSPLCLGEAHAAQVLADGGALAPLLKNTGSSLASLGSELVHGVRRRRRTERS